MMHRISKQKQNRRVLSGTITGGFYMTQGMLGSKKTENLAKMVLEKEQIVLKWIKSYQQHDSINNKHVVHAYRLKQYDAERNEVPLTNSGRDLLIKQAIKKGFYPVLDSDGNGHFYDGGQEGIESKLDPNEWYLMLYDHDLFDRVATTLHQVWMLKQKSDKYLQEEENTLREEEDCEKAVTLFVDWKNFYGFDLDVDMVLSTSGYFLDVLCKNADKIMEQLKKDNEMNDEHKADLSMFEKLTSIRGSYINWTKMTS